MSIMDLRRNMNIAFIKRGIVVKRLGIDVIAITDIF